MKRPWRGIFLALGPLVMGPTIAILALAILDDGFARVLERCPFFVIFAASVVAVIFFGIQSTCSALIMEIAFDSGLRPRSLRSVSLATLLGALSGALPPALRTGEWCAIAPFCGLGAVVGLLISSIIYFCDDPNTDAKLRDDDGVAGGGGV